VSAKRVLKFACAATLGFAFVEFLGGRFAHSLALIADSAHLLTDAGALGLALFAAWVADQPATRKMSYGFHRVEILAALVNGVGLGIIAIFLITEALERFASPPQIRLELMLGLGLAGLLFNLIVAGSLRKHARESVNVRSALYHVLADCLGSLGVVVAGLVIWKTGWVYADPAVSIGIACLIIWGAWMILRDVVGILLEAAPARVNIQRLERRLLALPGVEEICDLHVWTISSGKEALSAHLGVSAKANSDSLLKQVNEILSREFEIHHSTVQLEKVAEKPHKPHPTHRPQEF
jgi:cobalt-zinc-cadmium efflux system protein